MAKNEDASRQAKAEESNRRRRARTANATNTLRPSPAVVSWIFRAVSKLSADPQRRDDAAVQRAPTRSGSPEVARRSATQESENFVPDEVSARFVRVGRDFHFPSGARAFRDHGQKVVTHTENTAVVRAIVDIAVARGWNDITVSGTSRFRREAWRAATVSGLTVRGYRPTDFDKQKLVRELAAAREPSGRPTPLVDFPQPANADRASPAQRAQASTGTRAAKPAESSSAQRSSPGEGGSNSRERSYTGTLLEHGPATYQFHPHGEPSYFLRIQTSRGSRLLWGKDLERAVRDAKVLTGDEIHIRQAGREAVTVKHKERDQEGQVLKEHDKKAHRNHWEVVRDPRSDKQVIPRTRTRTASASADLGPDESALRALKAAQLFANERISDLALRSAFVNAVRHELAAALDRGDPAPATRLKDTRRKGDPMPARTMS